MERFVFLIKGWPIEPLENGEVLLSALESFYFQRSLFPKFYSLHESLRDHSKFMRNTGPVKF